MEYNVPVSQLSAGMDFEGFYLITNIQIRKTTSGKPFLSCQLADAEGTVEAKLWDYSGGFDETDNGRAVKVRGNAGLFKGMMQVTIQRIRTVTEQDPVDPASLVPCAPIDPKADMKRITDFIASLTDPDYRGICENIMRKHWADFTTIPAAKTMHHSFRHGLLMHTVSMLQLADFLADQYGEVIDRNLLIAGTLLHDIAKDREFTRSELGLVTDYSVEGNLLGHLVMGAQEVAFAAAELGITGEKPMLLQHLLLSHHGTPEFGAAVLPRCAESELLSYIDLIDSRMEIYAETLKDVPQGRFSQRVFALDKTIYNHG